MEQIINYQEVSIDFFIDIINWVFNEFLINITVLGIPVLYLYIAVLVSYIVISGLINTSKSSLGSSAPSFRRHFKGD